MSKLISNQQEVQPAKAAAGRGGTNFLHFTLGGIQTRRSQYLDNTAAKVSAPVSPLEVSLQAAIAA